MMTEMVEDNPIQDCEDCLHKPVCKHINVFIEMKQTQSIPIDFSTASCLYYLSETIIEDFVDDSDAGDLMYFEYDGSNILSILDQVVKTMKGQGEFPSVVKMSQETMGMFSDVVPIYRIERCHYDLDVIIDDSLPYGQFHVLCEGD